MNQMYKPLARLTKIKRDKTLNKPGSKQGHTNLIEIKMIIREKLYAYNLVNRLNWWIPRTQTDSREIENLNRPLLIKEIELVSKNIPKKKHAGAVNSTKYLKKINNKLPQILPKTRHGGKTQLIVSGQYYPHAKTWQSYPKKRKQ